MVHGPGDDPGSFGGIRQAALKNARTPAQGGDLTDWLMAFLKARTAVMKQEAAHSDLSRIEVQEQFIREKNWTLFRPLSWEIYGDSFSLE
ncbi:chitosanase [uncultured Faecalibaculum sp.]|uniref:chitosanase n=1 Tax=uncultured Faecalibaculum sp. TaxID=1729681 RepID=UPI002623A595|nr:chitosanase [uncultured Faecalibaculum sp.]